MQSRAFHIWPWEEETLSTVEYQRSLENLERFLKNVEVRELYTIEDLSASASLVGHDLQTVVAVRGKSIEQTIAVTEPGAIEPVNVVERKYVFTKSRPMSDTELTVIASDGHVLISQLRTVRSMGYRNEELRIRLPSDTDIAIGNIPNVSDESIYVIDIRGGKRSEFRPVQKPDSPEIQQAFTYILKDTLKDVVEALT